MSGSTFGRYFTITTWGESHGKALGVVVDGCPAGIPLCEEDIQKFLDRRKPGQSRFSTPRKEEDLVEILSGVFEGRTTGAPISMMVHNKTQRSADYSEIASYYRPGHADYTFDLKYGFRDYRGGGRSSARETIGRVAAGAIAVKLLSELGISFLTYVRSIGPVEIDDAAFDPAVISENPLNMPDAAAAERAAAYLDECREASDSSGGMVECRVQHMIAGLGDPVFEKLSANLAKAIFSIGAVKSFEIGDGITVSTLKGSQNNDPFYSDDVGHIQKKTNHSGGTLGGISDGSDLLLRVGFKPTPSIFAPQQTVNQSGENIEVQIKGRHDPVIVPRAAVVVEAMAALTITDALFANMHAQMSSLKKFYTAK
ncbi:MAG: chorismate synthase [Eubacteriales bacterium]|nr:chorismate synthase [Eubacteriales bacterium]